MNAGGFLRYVGEPDFHDGTVIRIEDESPERVSVFVRGFSEQEYRLDFSGSLVVQNLKAENMVLYAIAEMWSPTKRLFAFVNTNEQDPSSLEILADNLTVRKL
jgi:hypothetical protein